MRHSEGGHPTKGKVEPMNLQQPGICVCNPFPEYHLHKTPNEEIWYLTRYWGKRDHLPKIVRFLREKKQHDLFKTVYILAHTVCPLLLYHLTRWHSYFWIITGILECQQKSRTCYEPTQAVALRARRVKFHVAAHTGMVYSSLLEEQKQHRHIQNHSPPWFTLENKQWYHQAELGCQLYKYNTQDFWQIGRLLGSLTW